MAPSGSETPELDRVPCPKQKILPGDLSCIIQNTASLSILRLDVVILFDLGQGGLHKTARLLDFSQDELQVMGLTVGEVFAESVEAVGESPASVFYEL